MDTGAYTLPHCQLQPSSSFFSPRALNTNTPSSTSAAAPPYVTHLEQLSRTTLVAITSDGNANLIDKNTLRRIDGFQTAQQAGITNVGRLHSSSSDGTIWGVTDRLGKCSVFDARSGNRNGFDQKMQIDTPTSSPLLSLAFSSSSTPLLALGHELSSLDAPIYIYDLRQTAAPVLTYDQSHSDDVTCLQFQSEHQDPARISTGTDLLLSASTDGLITIYDLSKGSDEDESVLSAANTGSSLARGGWGGAASNVCVQKGTPRPVSDENDPPAFYSGIGSMWGISDMQTVGIWDVESTDPLLPPLSALPSTTLLPPTSPWQSRKWESDYIIDATPDVFSQGGLKLFTGDQAGAFSLLHIPSPPPLPPSPFDLDVHRNHITSTQNWTLQVFFPSLSDSAQGGHEDIVRCIQVDEAAGVLWSGGEDGRIVAWNIADVQQQSTPGVAGTSLAVPVDQTWATAGSSGASTPSSTRRSGGTPSGSRYKPYG